MTVEPNDIQQLRQEGESLGNAMMEVLQDLAEGGGGGNVPFVGPDPPDDPTVGELWWDTDDSSSGGSQPFRVVNVPIAFDTPGLVLTGIEIYTPAVDDVIPPYITCMPFIKTAWDGTTPVLHLGTVGGLSSFDTLLGSFPADLTAADNAEMGTTLAVPQNNQGFGTPQRFTATTPVTLMVDDGSGGDPGSAQGAGFFQLLIIAA